MALLDKVVLNTPKAMLKLYKNIFCTSEHTEDKIQLDLIIRVRVLLLWAITAEREGTHRALIVSNLLQMRQRHYRHAAFGPYSLQELLIDYLNKEGPVPENSNFYVEFANMMFLFYELQRFNLFNHDVFVKAMIRHGKFNYQEPLNNKLRLFMKSNLQSTDVQETETDSASNSFEQKLPNGNVDEKQLNNTTETIQKFITPDPVIISFIPTCYTTNNSSTTNSSTNRYFEKLIYLLINYLE